MAETAGRKFDARGESKLRMTWEFGVCFAIMQEMFSGKRALKDGEDVLRCDAMP